MDIPIPAWLKPYVPFIEGVAIAIAIVIGGWIASKWGNRLTRRAFKTRKLDAALGAFVASIVQYAILAAAVISALGTVGIHTTSLLAIFASAGLAVGLALQGSLTNFASGVLILLFRPFDLGDRITAGGQHGVVQDIGIFATTLLAQTGETIIVPNSAATGGSIINFSKHGKLRGSVDVTVNRGDVDKIVTTLEDAAKRTNGVLEDPAPQARFAGIAANAMTFTIYLWAPPAELAETLRAVRRNVLSDLEKAGIELPTATIAAQAA